MAITPIIITITPSATPASDSSANLMIDLAMTASGSKPEADKPQN